ncbi:MAG: dihydrofolate reductase [Bacteroidales bacterium]|nr:dihydrofolate reductase [Bacteroidales bacterium]
MTISIIAAVADNGAIGRNNQLLWHIKEDLRYFKRITTGHTVIMGRKTWESLGKPLPNRRNIVVSSTLLPTPCDSLSSTPTVEIYSTIEEALAAAAKEPTAVPGQTVQPSISGQPIQQNVSNNSAQEVFIIGGGEIYRQTLPYAHKLYLTLVHTNIAYADTFFPAVNQTEWREISRESFNRGETFESPFEFVLFARV